jgi:hypothetical protein
VRTVEQAGRFLEKHEDDPMATFAWARVLQRHLAGRRRLPDRMPGYYGMGDENEAVISARILAPAWEGARSALSWLRQMK